MTATPCLQQPAFLHPLPGYGVKGAFDCGYFDWVLPLKRPGANDEANSTPNINPINLHPVIEMPPINVVVNWPKYFE